MIKRFLACDPGKDTDPFAVVMGRIEDNCIYITAAKFWKNTDYTIVESEINNICKKHEVQSVIVEKNAPGNPVADALSNNYGLPVIRVFTSNKVKEAKQSIMDKSEMVIWMIRASQKDGDGHFHLKFVESESPYMKELERQWAIFGEYHKDHYEAPTGEHDDLMMALMILCHVCRRFIEFADITVLNKSYGRGQEHAYDKGILPEGGIPMKDIKMSIYYPK